VCVSLPHGAALLDGYRGVGHGAHNVLCPKKKVKKEKESSKKKNARRLQGCWAWRAQTCLYIVIYIYIRSKKKEEFVPILVYS